MLSGSLLGCAMARPSMWAHAYGAIPTLASQAWVDGIILDFYLLSIWYSARGRTHIRFVDIVSAMLSFDPLRNHQMPTQEEILLFQQRFYVDPSTPDTSRLISFIAFHHQHYFAVVFDYAAALAYVLGRRISNGCEHFDEELDDWETWLGPLYWDRLAALHGITPGDSDQVVVTTHNWPQNGWDCGPIAVFLLKHFMNSGLGGDSSDMHFPAIPCGHELRLQMLGAVREACRTSWEDYNMLSTSHLPENDIWSTWDNTAFVPDEDLAAMENEASGQQYAPVVQDLNIVCANCTVCQRHPWTEELVEPEPGNMEDEPQREVEEEGEEEEGEEGGEKDLASDDEQENIYSKSKATRLRKLFRLNPDTRNARCRDWMSSRAVKGQSRNKDGNTTKPSLNQRKHVKNWSEGTMFRFPRPTMPIDLPAYTEQRWLPFDRKFDDYEQAPTYESLQSCRNPYEFVVEPYYRQGLWSMFRDYGWRILPSFHQMFYLGDPLYVLDHVMVVGIPDGYESSSLSHQVTGGHLSVLSGMKIANPPCHRQLFPESPSTLCYRLPAWC